jgi:hypothetical protein
MSSPSGLPMPGRSIDGTEPKYRFPSRFRKSGSGDVLYRPHILKTGSNPERNRLSIPPQHTSISLKAERPEAVEMSPRRPHGGLISIRVNRPAEMREGMRTSFRHLYWDVQQEMNASILKLDAIMRS